MQEVKEALQKRINGSIGQATHYEEQAKQCRIDADNWEKDARKLREEAAELERIIEVVYGK